MQEWIWESKTEDRKVTYHEPKVPSVGAIVNGEIADEVGWPSRE